MHFDVLEAIFSTNFSNRLKKFLIVMIERILDNRRVEIDEVERVDLDEVGRVDDDNLIEFSDAYLM